MAPWATMSPNCQSRAEVSEVDFWDLMYCLDIGEVLTDCPTLRVPRLPRWMLGRILQELR